LIVLRQAFCKIPIVRRAIKMTIFVNKTADKKEDSNTEPPEVVGEVKVCADSCEKLK